MDKVKEQAAVAVAKGQQIAVQGQAKLDEAVVQGQAKVSEVQAKRAYDGLLRELGAAYYAAQRENGPSSAVDAALAAVDTHVAATGDKTGI
jgi:hypothetical protein